MLLGDRDRINERETYISDGNPQKIIEKLSKEAKYFYMDKNDKSDFVIFILDGNKLSIYESYKWINTKYKRIGVSNPFILYQFIIYLL